MPEYMVIHACLKLTEAYAIAQENVQLSLPPSALIELAYAAGSFLAKGSHVLSDAVFKGNQSFGNALQMKCDLKTGAVDISDGQALLMQSSFTVQREEVSQDSALVHI